jgi:hypothetical protein
VEAAAGASACRRAGPGNSPGKDRPALRGWSALTRWHVLVAAGQRCTCASAGRPGPVTIQSGARESRDSDNLRDGLVPTDLKLQPGSIPVASRVTRRPRPAT